ncbi:ankyrin repeat domain-containing protein [Solicola sp. PLA-1-18]|uniref:ankyrin repeat domain-containing protein n=1 Tax=Solicola sp. PLA-1-18 TaxID=3380532 RepID=UPI003B7AC308
MDATDETPAEGPSPELLDLAHQMFDLAREGDATRLGAYVEAGVPVDLTDASGNTLLMLAAYHGHVGTVQTLVGAGADVNRLNDRGQSPLAGAVFKGEDYVVSVLLGSGADPDAGSPTARATARMFGKEGLFS